MLTEIGAALAVARLHHEFLFQSAGFTPAALIVTKTFPEVTVGSDVL
jgi:hypothetical protein